MKTITSQLWNPANATKQFKFKIKTTNNTIHFLDTNEEKSDVPLSDSFKNEGFSFPFHSEKLYGYSSRKAPLTILSINPKLFSFNMFDILSISFFDKASFQALLVGVHLDIPFEKLKINQITLTSSKLEKWLDGISYSFTLKQHDIYTPYGNVQAKLDVSMAGNTLLIKSNTVVPVDSMVEIGKSIFSLIGLLSGEGFIESESYVLRKNIPRLSHSPEVDEVFNKDISLFLPTQKHTRSLYTETSVAAQKIDNNEMKNLIDSVVCFYPSIVQLTIKSLFVQDDLLYRFRIVENLYDVQANKKSRNHPKSISSEHICPVCNDLFRTGEKQIVTRKKLVKLLTEIENNTFGAVSLKEVLHAELDSEFKEKWVQIAYGKRNSIAHYTQGYTNEDAFHLFAIANSLDFIFWLYIFSLSDANESVFSIVNKEMISLYGFPPTLMLATTIPPERTPTHPNHSIRYATTPGCVV